MDPARPDLGLSIHAITAQSLAAEASLLAHPVSYTVVSTSGAEGIEDRATLLPLSARRLEAMVELGEGVIAIEALVAVQAIDLRGRGPLGRGTSGAHALIRERIPFAPSGSETLSDPGSCGSSSVAGRWGSRPAAPAAGRGRRARASVA